MSRVRSPSPAPAFSNAGPGVSERRSYNSDILSWLRVIFVSALFSAVLSSATAQPLQSADTQKAASELAATSNRTVLILPFHNDSKAPGLEWIGEAFSEV